MAYRRSLRGCCLLFRTCCTKLLDKQRRVRSWLLPTHCLPAFGPSRLPAVTQFRPIINRHSRRQTWAQTGSLHTFWPSATGTTRIGSTEEVLSEVSQKPGRDASECGVANFDLEQSCINVPFSTDACLLDSHGLCKCGLCGYESAYEDFVK
jgi:hypothetical protein